MDLLLGGRGGGNNPSRRNSFNISRRIVERRISSSCALILRHLLSSAHLLCFSLFRAHHANPKTNATVNVPSRLPLYSERLRPSIFLLILSKPFPWLLLSRFYLRVFELIRIPLTVLGIRDFYIEWGIFVRFFSHVPFPPFAINPHENLFAFRITFLC